MGAAPAQFSVSEKKKSFLVFVVVALHKAPSIGVITTRSGFESRGWVQKSLKSFFFSFQLIFHVLEYIFFV